MLHLYNIILQYILYFVVLPQLLYAKAILYSIRLSFGSYTMYTIRKLTDLLLVDIFGQDPIIRRLQTGRDFTLSRNFTKIPALSMFDH